MALKTRDQAYWDKRMELIAKSSYNQSDKTLIQLKKMFQGAFDEMSDEVATFYAKYGVTSQVPTFKILADGSKVINGTTSKITVPLNVANKQLAEGTRLVKLNDKLNDVLFNLSKDQKLYMDDVLGLMATNGYYDNIYEIYKGVGIGSPFSVLSKNQISALIRNEVNGEVFSSRIWANRDALARTVNQTIKTGISSGLSNRDMAKRIASNMDSGYKVAERLVRTESTNAYNQASKMGYEEVGINEYVYLSVLDNRTSDICSSLDGQVFKTAKAVTGLNYPPMHPNCRSTTIPNIIDRKQTTRLARDIETGNTFTVPGNMNKTDFQAIYVDKTMSRESWDKKN